MKRRVVVKAVSALVSASLLTTAGLGAASAGQDQAPAASETLRIVAFGSSSTEGVGATRPSASYPAQLQSDLTGMVPKGWKVEVINRGIGGEDADDMVRRLATDVIGRHPDVVIWQTGSNDPMNHVPLDRFVRETREGVIAMQKADIDVILMEPQWCPRLASVSGSLAYRDAVRRIGREMNVSVVRRFDLMREWVQQGELASNQMLAADGLHMTDGGYALLARSVAPEVLKLEDLLPKPTLPAMRTAGSPAPAATP